MLSKSLSSVSIYVEFYSLAYLIVLVVGVLVFSLGSSYKQKNITYLSDISIFSRFKLLMFFFLFFFCLVGGIPPFLSFVTKFFLFFLVSNSNLLIFILIFITSLLVYYLSIFKFLRVDYNYSKNIEYISFKITYILFFFFFINIVASYMVHILGVDLL